MPGLPVDSLRVVFSGFVVTGQSWSCSLWFRTIAAGLMTQTELNTANGDLGDAAVGSWATLASALWPSSTTLTKCTTYVYPNNTVTASKVSTPHTLAAAGSTTTTMPPQCAVVASLRSEVPGRSGRGRIYIPYTLAGLASDGQIASTKVDNVANAVAAMIGDMNALSLPGGLTPVCCVASFTKQEQPTVVSVVVDSIVDTQRRREGSMVATHAKTTNV